jgi:hypothetical protein
MNISFVYMKTLIEAKRPASSGENGASSRLAKAPDTPTPIQKRRRDLAVNVQNVADVVVKTFANTHKPQPYQMQVGIQWSVA